MKKIFTLRKVAILAMFLLSLISVSTVKAQNTLDKVGLSSGTPATTAFSLRLLNSSYSGPLVRILIGSNYYDVYPDASSNAIFSTSSNISAAYSTYNASSTGASSNTLSTILGSNNATIAIWYDQSGNGKNAIQATTSYQPAIVSSGTIINVNGFPSASFNASNYLRATLSSLSSTTPFTLNSIAAATSGNIVALSSTSGSNQNACLGAGFSGGGIAWFGGYAQDNSYNYGTSSSATTIRTKTYQSGTITGYVNSNSVFTNSVTYSLTTADVLIGVQNLGSNQFLSGKVQEVLVFTSSLSTTDRQLVEGNQSTYYSISSGIYSPTIGSFSVASKTYGASAFTLTAPTSNSAGAFTYSSSNTSVATVSGNTVTIVGAGTSTITATQAANGSYTSGSTTATLTVNPALLVVTANNQAVCSGTAIGAVTSAGRYFITGFIGGDNSSVISGTVNYSTNYTTNSTAGTTGLTISPIVTGLSASNYTFSAVDGTVSVNALPVVTGIVQPGMFGNGLSFDGSDDYVTVANSSSLNISNAITIEAWVYPTKNTGTQNVMCKSNCTTSNTGYIFPRTDDGWNTFDVFLHIGSWRVLSASFPSLNSWHHLAATYDGATIKLYLDGTLVNSMSASGSITTNSNAIAFGNQLGCSEYFGGKTDDIRIWNFARTQSQIQSTMNSELVGNESGLVGYYNFNQGTAGGSNGSVTTVTDITSNHNNGTLSNFALSGTISNWVSGASNSSAALGNVCVGSTLQLSNATSGGVWSSDATATASVDNNGLVTGVAAGSTTIHYTVTNANNCSTVVNTSITVNALPTATISAGSATTFCTGGSVTLTASAGASYLWSNGATTQAITVSAGGNYWVTVTNANGCSATSASTLVTVNPLPTVTISAGSSTAFCPGGSVTLTASIGASYSWSASAANATTPSVVISTGGSYSVTVTDANGCSATSANTTVTLNPTNTITLSSAAATTTQTVYVNTAITNIIYSTTNATGASFSGLPIGVSGSWSGNVVTINGTPTVSGVYNYTVTLTGGCGTVTASGSITVPSVSITSTATSAICAGTSVTFTATPLNATNPTYQWTKNGTAIAGATSSTYTTTTLANNDVIAVNMTVAGAGGSSSVIASGLIQNLDANKIASYSGSGSTWRDISGNNNNGTLNSASFATTNGFSYFNLGNSAISAPVAKNASMTYNVWAKSNNSNPNMLFNAGNDGNGPDLWLINNNFYWNIWDSYGSPFNVSTSIVDQNWHNYTVVVDATANNAKLYFDGVYKGTATYHISNSTNLFIGGGGNDYPFSGAVSSFQTYNRALTATEVLANYNALNGGGALTSNTITATVHSLPTASIGTTTAVCLNSTAPNVTFTGASGTAPYTFTYTLNGGASQTISTTSGNSVTVSAPTNTAGSYVYSLVSVLESSSTTCAQAQSGTATITVNPLTTASIGGNNEVCKNASSPNITFTGATGTAPYTFTYNINGGSNLTVVSSGNTATVAAPTGTVGTFVYNLVGVRDASSSTCYQSQAGTATIIIDALPTATITSGSTATCPGNTITLSVNTGTGLTYQWQKGGVNISGATAATYGATTTGVYTVEVTNSNNCSTTSNSITITIQDVTAPNVVTKPVTVYLDAAGSAILTASQVDNGSTDNCGIATMSLSKSTFSCSDINSNSSAINFTSSSDGVTTNANTNLPVGNSARTLSLWVKQSITSNNTIGGITHYGTNDCTGLMFGLGINGSNLTFWGGCRDFGSSLALTTNQWTYIAVTYDGNNNYVLYKDNSTQSFTLSGGLNTAVSKLFIGRETTNNGASYRNHFTGSIDEVKVYNRALSASEIAADRAGTNQSGIVAYFPFNEGSGTTVNDVIGGNTATLQNPTGSNWTTRNGGSGPVTTTLTVTDVNGNSASASSTITVLDNIAPIISCPATINANTGAGKCGATVTITNAAATDNCSVASIAGVRNDGLALTADYPKGNTTITWTATDASGNSSTCNQTITVTDNIAPSISCPSNISLTATSAAGAVATYTAPVGTDNCSGYSTTRTAGLASGSTFPIGVNTVTHTVTDASGNATSCSFTVTVLGVAPTITCPSNITVNNATGVCGNNVTYGSLSTTGYPAPTVTYSITSGSFFAVGTTTVTVTASNAVGTASCTFTVTVLDTTAPVISCPTDILVSATDLTGADITYTTPVGTDNCSGANTVRTAGYASGYHFPVGTTTVTHVVTDASNNTASCSFKVTVNPLPLANISGTTAVCNNSTAPTVTFTGSNATAPYTFTYTINGGAAQTVTSSGNVATVTAPTSTTGVYTYALVSVQDASSTHTTNTASGSAVITVDTLPTPTISGPTYGGCGHGSTVSYTAGGATSYLWDAGLSPNTATNTFTTVSAYTANVVVTDGHGCTSSASQLINANTSPTITSIDAQYTLVETAITAAFSIDDYETPNNLSISTHSSNTALIPDASIVVTGSGANRNITVTPAMDQIGTSTITVTVTDCGGLSATTTYTVEVKEPPYSTGTANFVIRKLTSQIDHCSDSVYIVNRSFDGIGTKYQWYINGAYFTKESFLRSSDGLIGFKETYPGTYKVFLVVTEPNGLVDTATKFFTLTKGIVPVPSPSFAMYGPTTDGHGTATVQLNNTTPYIAGGTDIHWDITPGTHIAGYEQTFAAPVVTIAQIATAQTLTVNLSVTPTNGCQRYTTSQTIVIPAYSPIVSGVSASVTKATDACNDSVTIFNTTTGGIGNTYTWYLGDGSTITTTNKNPIGKVYTYPGTYTILLNITDQNGQVSSKQTTVTTTGTIPAVTAVPVVYGPTNTTDSSAVILNGGNSTIAYGSLTYNWVVTPTVGGVASYNTASVPLTIARTNADQTYTAVLTVQDALTGCRTSTGATQTFVIPHLDVVVVPPPTGSPLTADFTVNVTKSITDPCSDSVYITNSTTGGGSANAYTWYLGDGTTINTTSTAVIGKIYTFPATYTIQMNVTDNAGHSDSKSVTVTTVGTIPAVTAIPVIYGPNNTTDSSTVVLNGGNSTIPYGALTYSWTVSPTVGGVASYSTTSVPLTIARTNVDQTYTATLTVQDALTGCRTNASSQTFVIPQLGAVVTPPAPSSPITADFTVNVTKSIIDPCNDSVYITNLSTGTGNTYTWYLGDGSMITTTNTNVIGKVYTYPATYTILLNVKDAAGNYASKQTTVTTIGTIPAITAVPLVYGPYDGLTASTVNLNAGNSTIPYGGLSYLWTVTPNVDGIASYNTAGVPLTITRTGADQTYTATLTVTDALTGCRSNTASTTFTVNQLSARIAATTPVLNETNVVRAYPNPATNNVKVKVSLARAMDIGDIKVYNNMGVPVVLHNVGKKSVKDYSTSISVSNLPSGIYYLKVYSQSGELLSGTNVIKH